MKKRGKCASWNKKVTSNETANDCRKHVLQHTRRFQLEFQQSFKAY